MIMERRIKAIIISLAIISTLSAVLADRVAAQDYVAPSPKYHVEETMLPS